MAGRTALATPTNVRPSNGYCVQNNNKSIVWSFTNQCDLLTWVTWEIYDATTNEKICDLYAPGNGNMSKPYHKGDTVTITSWKNPNNSNDPLFISGRHYKYTMCLYTNRPTVNGGDTYEPNCCVPYASGKILNMQYLNKIYIQKGIKKLRKPYYWAKGTSREKLVGCTYMRIGNEERMVVDYDSSSGLVTLASNFPQELFNGHIGDVQWFLYCNYIETGSYDYYLREPIQSKMTCVSNDVGINCSATYYQSNNVGMESYRFMIYAANNDICLNGTVQAAEEDTENSTTYTNIPIQKGIQENIVSHSIRFEETKGTFTDGYVSEGYAAQIVGYNAETGIALLGGNGLPNIPEEGTAYSILMNKSTLLYDSGDIFNYDLNFNFPVYAPNQNFEIWCELKSYEKQGLAYSIDKKFPIPSNESVITSHNTIVDNENQRVTITFETDANAKTDGLYKIFRRDNESTVWRYIGRPLYSSRSGRGIFIDCLAGNNMTYEYAIYRESKSSNEATFNNEKPYIITGVETKWDGWTITSLLDYKDSSFDKFAPAIKGIYRAGETWHFISDINSGDITMNLGIHTHLGTSTYPTMSRTNNAYTSGSFSANLLTLICPSGKIYDDIEKVRKWENFINGDNQFILKSDKGDVWIIAITDNTSRSYDESVAQILTNVSYSWAETVNSNDVLIISDAETVLF